MNGGLDKLLEATILKNLCLLNFLFRPPKQDVERVASLVASLITTDERFADLKPLLQDKMPVFQEDKRHEIKCLIDAEIAHLFGLTDIELRRVLERFDKVHKKLKIWL
ncbi:MAG: hypothetical protein IPK14_15585 [Blastocatellia bacterium]|nr:hypothetical protein [Blastocatellia bacterium]